MIFYGECYKPLNYFKKSKKPV